MDTLRKILALMLVCWNGSLGTAFGQDELVIGVNEDTLIFNENDPPQAFMVTSSGAPLTWKLLAPQPSPQDWFTLSFLEGTTPTSVTVQVDRAKVCSNNNQVILKISQVDMGGLPVGQPVEVTIIATTLSVSPTSLHFPNEFSIQTFGVRNTGGSDAACKMSWQSKNVSSWLNVEPNRDETNPQETTEVKVSVVRNSEFDSIIGMKPAAEIIITGSGPFTEIDTLNVIVNRAPRVVDPIADFEMTEGCPETAFDIDSVFEDLDRDALTYSLKADSQAVIAFIQRGTTTLVLQPQHAGTDTIIIFAEDDVPAVASDTLFVTVKANEAPRFTGSNPVRRPLKMKSNNQTPCSPPDTVRLGNYFSDEGCGALTFDTTNVSGAAAAFEIRENYLLIITAKHEGTATASVKATDAQGLAANEFLIVEATVGRNIVPSAIASFEFTLTVDGAAHADTTLDLDRVFVDMDNGADSLTYDVSGVDNDKLAVEKPERERLRIEVRDTPAESTQFMVRATDPCDESGATEITVLINHRPFVENEIQNKVLTLQGLNANPTFELWLKEVFDDSDMIRGADRERLQFKDGLASSNSRVVTAEIIGSAMDSLRVSAHDTGRARITVTANDGRGGKRSTSFQVAVRNSNRAPEVCGEVKPIIVFAGQDNPSLISLNLIFCDPDNDRMFFTGRSANDSIASVTIYAGDSLSVQPVRPDTTYAWVTAHDGHGDSVAVRFSIWVRESLPPIVTEVLINPPCPILDAQSPVKVELTTTVKDDYGIPTVILFGRISSDSSFVRFFMAGKKIGTASDSLNIFNFTGEFPPSLASSKAHGIDYYITVFDQDNDTLYYPERNDPCKPAYNSIQLCFASQELVFNVPPTSSKTESGYRLISLPFWLNQRDPASILLPQLGAYDNAQWRFSEPRGESFVEYPNTSDMIPGKAFWLAVRGGLKTVALDSGKTTATNTPFVIPLQHGWNYVGTPFNFDIPIEKHISFFKNKNVLPVLRSYEGEWNSVPVHRMQPGKGYALFVEDSTFIPGTNAVDRLLIDADFSPDTCSTQADAPTLAWSIRILAQCQQARDGDNLAAITANRWEKEDQHEPPVVGEFVSVYFAPAATEKTFAKYCRDLRAESSAGDTWDFEVITNIHDRVDLTFEGLAQVPGEFEVWLLDEKLNVAQNLREDNHYSIAGPSPANPKRLQLAVGKKEYLGEKLERVLITPVDYELSQNFPNPFNPATTIRYGLPQTERVTLKVYNMLGEEVAALLESEVKAPGYHTAIWNGCNRNGEAVGSGVYVYKLEAGKFVSRRKMVLLQ